MLEVPVTQGFWQAVMGTTLDWSSKGKGPRLPVYNVDYGQAEVFAEELTLLLQADEQMPTDWNAALPTEVQWEYAARAGTTTLFPFGDDEGKLTQYAWFDKNSDGKPHDVATQKPNLWGLHDMLGNVWEWCADGYGDNLPGGIDPRGPSGAPFRVIRGGSWGYTPRGCRPAYCNGCAPEGRFNGLGFRVAAVQD